MNRFSCREDLMDLLKGFDGVELRLYLYKTGNDKTASGRHQLLK